MATKRPQLKITKSTTPETPARMGNTVDDELPATGRTQPVGIGLKESEYAALGEIAQATGIARNSLARFAIRQFIIAWRKGEIDLASRTEEPPTPKKRLRM